MPSTVNGLENLAAAERKVYSQNGEDGVIEAIFAAIGTTDRFCVEFGVENATECNSANLLEQGWTGLLMDPDGTSRNPRIAIKNEFITAENINDIFAKHHVPQVFDLLSIDIDGNDYWVWRELRHQPRVVVIEYNASVPPEFRLVIPYDPKFQWNGSDYFGASLRALTELGDSKGYQLVHCERAGANAFFVARSELPPDFVARPLQEVYRPANYFYEGVGHRAELVRGMIDPALPDSGRITPAQARAALIAQTFDAGARCHIQGDVGSAEGYYRRVLELAPAHVNARSNLGVVLQATGRPDEAIACFSQAVEINPNHADAHNNLGNALKDQGQLTAALTCFEQALRLNPNHVNAHCNLGNVYAEQKRTPDAITCFREALRLNPSYYNAAYNLGNALRDQGELAPAIDSYRQALAIDPNQAKAHNNLGNALRDLGRGAEAAECFRRALQLDSRHVGALVNLAETLKDEGHFEASLGHYGKALAMEPNHKVANFNRSMLYLLLGDFRRGWPDYEHRFMEGDNTETVYGKPRWRGAGLAGKTILLHAEQGLGDTLQFIRYAPLVRERKGEVSAPIKVLVECQRPLVNLVRTLRGIDQVIPAGDPLPDYDVQVPLLSVPGILDTSLATIPTSVPYLHASAERVAYWRGEINQRLAPAAATPLKIGIVWQGNPKFRADRTRSIPLKHFSTLASVPEVKLFSLQVGPGASQLASASFPVIDLGSRFNPDALDDLAAVMVNLDLIITGDTSVPHLAGALGVPIWVALSFVPDWRVAAGANRLSLVSNHAFISSNKTRRLGRGLRTHRIGPGTNP